MRINWWWGALPKSPKNTAVPMAHVSLAWLLHKNAVGAPVIGATKIAHLESAVEAVDLKLDPEDIAYLEEPYTPHPVVGLIPYGGQLLLNRR